MSNTNIIGGCSEILSDEFVNISVDFSTKTLPKSVNNCSILLTHIYEGDINTFPLLASQVFINNTNKSVEFRVHCGKSCKFYWSLVYEIV